MIMVLWKIKNRVLKHFSILVAFHPKWTCICICVIINHLPGPETPPPELLKDGSFFFFFVYTIVAFCFLEKGICLERKFNGIPLSKSHHVFLLLFFNRKKKFPEHQIYTWYLQIWCEPCLWFRAELKSGSITETRAVMILIKCSKK